MATFDLRIKNAPQLVFDRAGNPVIARSTGQEVYSPWPLITSGEPVLTAPQVILFLFLLPLETFTALPKTFSFNALSKDFEF